jgi:homoserine dehydrogenase
MEKKNVNIALIGCGTVGSSVARILTQDMALLKKKTGKELVLKRVVEKDFTNAKALGLDTSLFSRDLGSVLSDRDIDIVLELVGGTTFAKEVISASLSAGKDVVTANKALLALHGTELLQTAREHGKTIAFEASCAGGIPILRALYDGLIANRIEAIYGIVNGTCNYILTEMTGEGKSYAEALADAQALGLAEADPSLDVSGEDSAHKIAVMAAMAYGRNVPYKEITVQGIDKLAVQDVIYGSELGYVVKLLAIAATLDKGLCIRVRPAFISLDHPIAWVSGPFNAVSVYGHNTGHTMYYGRGAGGLPTASAVVSDIISLASGSYPLRFTTNAVWPTDTASRSLVSVDHLYSRHYVRMMVQDKPGTLARITSILGSHNISISSILQKELEEDTQLEEGVPIVITTHIVQEANIRNALEEADRSDVVTAPSVLIPIVDEHEETL